MKIEFTVWGLYRSILGRNIYIIAHRCNDLKTPGKALTQGVNGIEADVWHDEGKWHISHDGKVKQDLEEWLRMIAGLSYEYKDQFAVLLIDIKNKVSIKDFIDVFHRLLPEDLNIIYSVARIADAEIFREIVNDLNKYEMLAIDEEDEPSSVDSFFHELQFRRGLYGHGIDALMLSAENYQKALTKAASIRDSSAGLFKTFTWTLERKKTIKKYFSECKVDGILVNLDSAFKKPVQHALKICNELNLKLGNRKTLNNELTKRISQDYTLL